MFNFSVICSSSSDRGDKMFGNNNKQPRLSVFQSADTARQFLQQCYKQLHREDAVQRSYTNCYPFLYYFSHFAP